MSRRDTVMLRDIAVAISAIRRHLRHGELSDELVFDAVRMRLIEVGEAAKALSDEARGLAPSVPWRLIAGMRDRLTHRYFESDLDIIASTIENDLPLLLKAIDTITGSDED